MRHILLATILAVSYLDVPDATTWTPHITAVPADSLTVPLWTALQLDPTGVWAESRYPALDRDHWQAVARTDDVRRHESEDTTAAPFVRAYIALPDSAAGLWLLTATMIRRTNYAMGDSLPPALPQLSAKRAGGSPVVPMWGAVDLDTAQTDTVAVTVRFWTTPPDPRVGYLEE